ncbi:hypothetical protein [Aquimarina algiphila]|uniref:hypothetical protein n=1 Tax=Aquimarina algiphila TaxID=2047982 RepID=UPI00232F6BB8|nr:hypothetical protein [Aquimarina algiphila]
MTKLHYICLLLFGFFALQSCQSQKANTTANNNLKSRQVVADAIAYHIIKDSVYCKGYEDDVLREIELLQVEYHDKAVQDSLNNFFFRKQVESIGELNDLEGYNGSDFQVLKRNIKRFCSVETFDNAPSHINIAEFEVILNRQNIFTIDIRNYDWNGRGHIETYSFNLDTGKRFIDDEVFNDNIDNLFDDLSLRMLNTIKSDLEDIKNDNDLSDEDKKGYEEEYNNYIKDKQYQITTLPEWQIVIIPEWSGLKEKNTLGIEFRIYKNLGKVYFGDPYDSEFYTMKQMEPYLTEEFRSL